MEEEEDKGAEGKVGRKTRWRGGEDGEEGNMGGWRREIVDGERK